MSHLIAGTTEQFDLQKKLDELRAAHAYLAKHGARALKRAAELGPSARWGQSVKRLRVELPSDSRPELTGAAPSEHSITEVYNQCANVERLIDAVKWCLSPASKFSDGLGLACHPTTSSNKFKPADYEDHDLVVQGVDGQLGYFEVSDVASNKDGNFKEGKDLVRLGLLRPVAGQRGTFEHGGIEWPRARLFLVVSEEFAEYLCRTERSWRKGPEPHIRYEDRSQGGSTRILEILPGVSSARR
jgi:hypothetical protein